ncbi:MAG: hypothetical protein NVSMB27_31480 [Ktedonobacteraceae bacterium]
MPPGTVENHAAIVYLSQKDAGSALLRYDVTTGLVQTILQTNGNGAIQAASVSPDGQWILLVSHLQDQSAIQVIRVDGQQLQTLYCAPAQEGIDAALLSPNQHSLVFNQVSADDSISILYFLDMTTGKLQTELSPLHANYPGSVFEQPQTTGVSLLSSFSSQNTTSAGLESNQFNPGPSKHYLFYIPMQWANNSVYLLGTVGGSSGAPHRLALLRDIRKDVTQQQSNLLSITGVSQENDCQDYHVMPDHQQFVCSSYILIGPISPSTITLQAITGGARHLVYSDPTGGRIVARAISNSTLIFMHEGRNSPPALWKINSDGSGLTRLMAAQTTDTLLGFAYASYLPWSITSHDSMFYAINVANLVSNTQSLVFGSLNGGTPKTLTSSAGSLWLVGWAGV